MTPIERRFKFRQGLHPLYAEKYDLLCEELDPEVWNPYFGIRTFAEQNEMYSQGRSFKGPIITNAKGGQSPHEYGCATDWAYFEKGNLIWLPPTDPKWTEYEGVVRFVGLIAGADFHHPDTDHNELKLDVKWTDVLVAYNQGGPDVAAEFISKHAIVGS